MQFAYHLPWAMPALVTSPLEEIRTTFGLWVDQPGKGEFEIVECGRLIWENPLDRFDQMLEIIFVAALSKIGTLNISKP